MLRFCHFVFVRILHYERCIHWCNRFGQREGRMRIAFLLIYQTLSDSFSILLDIFYIRTLLELQEF